MDITPLPGVRGTDLLVGLVTAQNGLINVRGAGGDTRRRLEAYVNWAAEAVRQMRRLIHDEDLRRLVLTDGYRDVLGAPRDSDAVFNAILDGEIDVRLADLGTTCEQLRTSIDRWSRGGVLTVLDTSVYLTADKIEDLDLAVILEVREQPIQLLVPIAVIDELDRLKQSHDKDIRWRASYTLAFLDQRLGGRDLAGRIREEDFSALDIGGIPRGRIDAEIVLDPLAHVRLPITDDEIVDRARTIQGIAGLEVHLVTYDTGMGMRARAADLRVHKLRSGKQPN